MFLEKRDCDKSVEKLIKLLPSLAKNPGRKNTSDEEQKGAGKQVGNGQYGCAGWTIVWLGAKIHHPPPPDGAEQVGLLLWSEPGLDSE